VVAGLGLRSRGRAGQEPLQTGVGVEHRWIEVGADGLRRAAAVGYCGRWGVLCARRPLEVDVMAESLGSRDPRVAAERRDQVANARDDAAQRRDEQAYSRDVRAAARDRIAQERDNDAGLRGDQLAARLWTLRDYLAGQLARRDDMTASRTSDTGHAVEDQLAPETLPLTLDQVAAAKILLDETIAVLEDDRVVRARSASDRRGAAADRRSAADDRRGSAHDRDDSYSDRQQSTVEREQIDFRTDLRAVDRQIVEAQLSSSVEDILRSTRTRITESQQRLDRHEHHRCKLEPPCSP
jgi:hypothetical protein